MSIEGVDKCAPDQAPHRLRLRGFLMPEEVVMSLIAEHDDARTAMSRLPKPETCRGWLTSRARNDGIDWLDCLFDEWALLVWGPAPWRG